MLTELGIVRVGLEIEVPAWTKRKYQDVAADLVKKGFMLGDQSTWKTYHKYGCQCADSKGGCKSVRSGNVYIPPLVSLTYDGTLPVEGAEFVTSTVLMLDDGLDDLRPIWDIVVKDAVWSDTIPDKYGKPCSPSIHLHVSARSVKQVKPVSSSEQSSLQDDLLHALSLFAPEFIALASLTDNLRGITYRQPLRFAEHEGHHGFIHVRKYMPDMECYIEWRMFEAAYTDWEYVEKAAFLSAVLTRALINKNAIAYLMQKGYQHPFDQDQINSATAENSLDMVLDMLSKDRLTVLRDMCLVEAKDDSKGLAVLTDMFNQVEKQYG